VTDIIKLIIVLLVAGFNIALADWIRVIEIVADPVKDGERIYTFRFAPERTQDYDYISFECVYHQEIPWVNPRGEKYIKIHEPVTFTYRRKNVRLVADLDYYISFRVPFDYEDLCNRHGPNVFHANYPITVSRIKVTAVTNNVPAWSIELPSEGKFEVSEKLGKPGNTQKKSEENVQSVPKSKTEDGGADNPSTEKSAGEIEKDIGTVFFEKFGAEKPQKKSSK
jgi:hypothetical protein